MFILYPDLASFIHPQIIHRDVQGAAIYSCRNKPMSNHGKRLSNHIHCMKLTHCSKYYFFGSSKDLGIRSQYKVKSDP